MGRYDVFNHLAPTPSLLSNSPQFHMGTRLSHGDVTHVSQEAESDPATEWRRLKL